MHHTYVEVEEGVLLVDPNFLVPPKGEDILLYKTPIFLSPPPKVGDVFLHNVVPIPLFPQKVDILLHILRWGYCWLTPLSRRKGASEGIPKTRGLGHSDSCGGH
jgi:hypothetical protein